MASISKHTSKDGSVSYYFRCFAGTDTTGKKIYRREKWPPPSGMSAAKAEKEAARRADEFEQRVQNGLALDCKMTLDEFLEKWFAEYARPQLKAKTVADYEQLRPRVSQALGHLKLDKIRPSHLLQFYDNIAESGQRLDTRYTATAATLKILNGMERKEAAQAAGIAERTLYSVLDGENVTRKTALKLATAVGLAPSKAFQPVAGAESKLSGSTQRHYHRFLSSVFSTAVEWQLIAENPCSRVKGPKAKPPEVKFLDDNEVAALLDALPDAPPICSTIVQLALLTGARRGELCALRWSDIDLEKAAMQIRRNVSNIPKQGLVFDTPKTARSIRTLKLSKDAVQLLQEWRKTQLQERLKVGTLWARYVDIDGQAVENDLLFTRWNGEPFDPDYLSSWFPRFLREHSLPAVRFHSLRHTNATLLIAAHAPITTVSGRLGHASTATTLQFYAASIRSADAAAADALDSIFDSIKKGASAG